jgi:hypothetical protein
LFLQSLVSQFFDPRIHIASIIVSNWFSPDGATMSPARIALLTTLLAAVPLSSAQPRSDPHLTHAACFHHYPGKPIPTMALSTQVHLDTSINSQKDGLEPLVNT